MNLTDISRLKADTVGMLIITLTKPTRISSMLDNHPCQRGQIQFSNSKAMVREVKKFWSLEQNKNNIYSRSINLRESINAFQKDY